MTRTSRIIVAGFLVRAFLAQALFWISYLRLPIGRSLQLGNGFWFFAADGPSYLFIAQQVALKGFPDLLFIDLRLPSRLFVQLLALLFAVFGANPSLAILINCAAYALTCAVLLRIGRNDVVLAAIAFSPAAMLFSLQLLKDTLFALLIVLMIASFRWWQELWRSGSAPGPLVASAMAMVASVFALAGIRWYFAAIVLAAAAIFLVLVSLQTPRRSWALAVSAVLFVLLAQAVRLGSLDIPSQIASALNPTTVLEWNPQSITKFIAKARRGFDTTPGATTIAAGPRVEQAPLAESGAQAFPMEPVSPIPKTFASRVITGFSATFLPRFVAQSLGLVRVGGGRGLWLFAEIDTIVLDLVLLYAIVSCWRALRSTASATPLFIMLILVFVMTAGPMIYTVNNFGTIFRLRLMLYVIAAVIPMTLRMHEDTRQEDSLPTNS